MIVEHLPLYILSIEHFVEAGTDGVELQGFGTGKSPTAFLSEGRLSWGSGR